MKSAEVISMEDLKVGVTRPRRAKLAPGGLVESIAWKPIKPGRYGGFAESYKSEVAAYEMDKLLGLGMVPPTVEKTLKGEVGAAVMWVSPTKSFKELGGVPGQPGVKGPPPAFFVAWTRQLTKAKMFDNLIGNIDPNLGNWLVDPAWNLILIDHTRAFTTTSELYHKLGQYDVELWDKMKVLDEQRLTEALGDWLEKNHIRAILQRRDKMQRVIEKLSAENSEHAETSPERASAEKSEHAEKYFHKIHPATLQWVSPPPSCENGRPPRASADLVLRLGVCDSEG